MQTKLINKSNRTVVPGSTNETDPFDDRVFRQLELPPPSPSIYSPNAII